MELTSLYVIGRAVPLSPFLRQFPLVALFAIFTAAVFVYLVHHDFCAFKALGPGGTPSTLQGYIRIKFLSLFAISNPLVPANIPPLLVPQAGYLRYLPPRPGFRPIVTGIAPHRQLNQRPPPEIFGLLVQSIYTLAREYPRHLMYGTSCLEKHGPGLFTTLPPTRRPNCSTEICHSHPSDGSTHLTLHPADAALVLANGWGQRHPLGRGGWLNRFVPSGFTLVYAPRTAEEVVVVNKIVNAAIWWVGGLHIQPDQLTLALEHW